MISGGACVLCAMPVIFPGRVSKPAWEMRLYSANRVLRDQHGFENLIGDFLDRSRGMREEQRAGFVAFADGLEGVEVLRDEDQLHHVAGGCAFDGLLELLDRGLQSFDNRLA